MTLLPAKRVRHPATIRYALKIAEISRRGDIDLLVDSLKKYWHDKKEHPWHRILTDLGKKGPKTLEPKEIAECIGHIRDGLFAALNMLSIELAMDITTESLLEIILKEPSWKDGRRKARNFCGDLVKELINKGKLDLLVPTGLEHDGFRYLVPDYLRKRLEIFESAKPEVTDGVYNLRPLQKSSLGRQLLRQLNITTTKLSVDDPLAEELLTLHSHLLLDMELEESSYVVNPEDTAQITLNGEIIEEIPSQEETSEEPKSEDSSEMQVALTEYISKGKDTTPKKKAQKASTRKKTAQKAKASEKSRAKEKSGKRSHSKEAA